MLARGGYVISRRKFSTTSSRKPDRRAIFPREIVLTACPGYTAGQRASKASMSYDALAAYEPSLKRSVDVGAAAEYGSMPLALEKTR